MKLNLPHFGDVFDGDMMRACIRLIEQAFAKIRIDDRIIIGGGTAIVKHLSATASLNFAAPGAVPGICAVKTIAVPGAAMGDTVVVSALIGPPAGFVPPIGWVSATDVVTVTWFQLTGVAADPDGAGTTYRADVWKH